jgi:cobalt-zinc-cadmium efflux system outer membrane protein
VKSIRIVVLVSVLGGATGSARLLCAAEGPVIPSPDPCGTRVALSNDLSCRALPGDANGSASAAREGLGGGSFIGRGFVSSGDERSAGPPVDPPTLEALVAEALAQNPDVRALQEAVAASHARPEKARALPDPMVSALFVNDGWSPSLGERDMTTLGFMASQTLPWPGKRSLREEIATRDTVPPAERLERQRLSIAAGTRRAFWSLVLAEESLGVLREQEEVWREAEAAARARYAVGQGAQQDVLRAQVEITRFEQLRAEQEAAIEARLAELSRLAGRDVTRDAVAGARLTLRPEPRDLTALLAQAEATLPELRAGAAGVERERLAVELARHDFKPDFSLQAGYMNRAGLDPMWQAGVGVTLPLQRGRRHAAVAEAEAGRRAAALEVEAVRAQVRYRTRERVAQLRAAERMATVYADGLLPQARLSYEASIASYQAGKVPFLTVLEALSTLYRDRIDHLRLLAAHERIKASIAEASLEATSEMPSGAAAGMASLAGAFGGAGEMAGGASAAAPAGSTAMPGPMGN